ncbi:hypothetical protein [Caulobacter sp. DWR2-3-1b2]
MFEQALLRARMDVASAVSRPSTRARVSPARAGSPKRLKTRTTVPAA